MDRGWREDGDGGRACETLNSPGNAPPSFLYDSRPVPHPREYASDRNIAALLLLSCCVEFVYGSPTPTGGIPRPGSELPMAVVFLQQELHRWMSGLFFLWNLYVVFGA